MSTVKHPQDEILVGLASGGLTAEEEQTAAAHLVECDECRSAAAAFARRVDSLAQPAAELPAALIERATQQWRGHSPTLAASRPAPRAAARGNRSAWLVPAAIAAGVLLWFGLSIDDRGADLERGVRIEQSLHIHRDRLDLYTEATASSPAVTTLTRGARIVVLEKRGDWWKVQADDGATGWAQRRLLSAAD